MPESGIRPYWGKVKVLVGTRTIVCLSVALVLTAKVGLSEENSKKRCEPVDVVT